MGDRRASDRALVEAVISDLPGGVLMTDPAGRIVHANAAAARILGRSREALLGTGLARLRPELGAMLGTASKAEIELPAEGEAPARTIGFSSRRISDRGADLGMLVSFADITDDLARRRDKAHQHRLADLGKVVASVAHEIRNPIFAISSLSQLLADEEAIEADEDLSLMVGKIRAEAIRVARLLEDLLAFGRDRPLSPREFDVVADLDELVTDLRDVVSRAEREVNVPLSLQVGDALRAAPKAYLDPDALRRVVVNLVRNARRAVAQKMTEESSDGALGRVVVRADRDPALVIAVDDDGIGIDPEHREQIFEAFFSRDPKGTGLGLAIVRRLLDQLGGTIDVASEPGRGTTITIRVPAPEPPRSARLRR